MTHLSFYHPLLIIQLIRKHYRLFLTAVPVAVGAIGTSLTRT